MSTNELVEYNDADTLLEGYVAYPDDKASAKGAILIVHDWTGRNQFACDKADKLASLGYIGFALDMYGKGKLGQTKEEKTALMSPLVEDRNVLLKRITAGLNCLTNIDGVDTNKVAVMGFCFGGLCALDLARSGANLAGAASFHGLLNAPENTSQSDIRAKILVLHGYADPMVPPEQLNAFCDEMTQKKADWQVHSYGNVLHAFTNPQANDPDFGTVYNQQADKRSWAALTDFLRELWG